MFILASGLVLFIGVHLLPTATGMRTHLHMRMGKNTYMGIHSLISLAGIILIVYGFSHTDRISVYLPVPGLRPVAVALMAVSIILLAAANMPGNIKRFTRHPMLWGVTLWAVAHLLANGDRAGLVLFGGMGLYALSGMYVANRHGAQFQEQKQPPRKDIITIIAGLLAYALLMVLHPYLFGVKVL